MSQNPKEWKSNYSGFSQSIIRGREMSKPWIPMVKSPLQQEYYPKQGENAMDSSNLKDVASEFKNIFSEHSASSEDVSSPVHSQAYMGYASESPVTITEGFDTDNFSMIDASANMEPYPYIPVEVKTPIQMSFIDAIAKAKEKPDDEEQIQDSVSFDSDSKSMGIAESFKLAISRTLLVSDENINVSKTCSESDITLVNQKASTLTPKAHAPYKIQKKQRQAIPFDTNVVKVSSIAKEESPNISKNTPIIEIRPIKSDKPKKRKMYTILEMIDLRSCEKSKIIPEVFAKSEGQDRYLRTFKPQKRYNSYKRSKTGWVITKERLSKMDKDSASIESIKITLQKTLNKITKTSFDKFIKEFLNENFATPEIAEILIERIFSVVSANNPCIDEFAQLIKLFDSFYRQHNSDKPDHFINRAISIFKNGTRIKPEWLENYNNVLNKKASTIDQLDEKNEELQMLEQSQRYILNGSAKMLGYLLLKGLIDVKDSVSFIQSVAKSTNELEIEMLCVYLRLIMPEMQMNKQTKPVVDNVLNKLENSRKAFQMRLRYIVLDIVTLHKNNWNVPRATVSVTTKNISTLRKDTIMTPNRTPVKSTDSTKAFSNNPFSSLSKKTRKDDYGNKNNQKYRDRSFKPQKPEPPTPEIPPVHKINIEATKSIIFPILNDFSTDFDCLKIIYDLKDLEVSSYMNVFVNLTFQYLMEKFNYHQVYYGQMFHFLIKRDRLSSQMLLKGLKKFMKGFNSIVDDVPIASKIVARILTPSVVSKCIDISQYYDILVKRNINNIDGCIVNLIDSIVENCNDQTAREVIQSSKSNDVLNKIFASIESIKSKPKYRMFVTSSPSESPEIHIESKNLLETISNMKKNQFSKFTRDFTTLIHYCCPPWSEALKKYISELCKEHTLIFNSIVSKKERIRQFTESLKQVFDRAHKQPSKLFLTLFDIFVKEYKLECNLIKSIIDELDDEILDAEIFELGKD